MGVPSTSSSRTKTARPSALWPVTTVRTFIPCLFSSGLFMVTFLDRCNLVFIFNSPFVLLKSFSVNAYRRPPLEHPNARVAEGHVSLAHLLSASASWWAIRGVIPIHSTGVPNARMTLPPLVVTAYLSSPSSSGVRAPWVNLPVSPSGVPWARVSAFIAWIVSDTFACCTTSLNHRSPSYSSSCIMVSIRAGSLELLGRALQRRAKASGGLRLHLCETALHEQLRSCDIAAV